MNRPERLLGGYATGTLTEAEKKSLFAAALKDQELFDALMDEEALRELLADPAARQRLLAVLPRPEQPKARTLWRRPAVIGLAASLFALVTTSLLVWRSSQFRILPVVQSEASVTPGAVAQDKAEPVPSGFAPPKPASPPKVKSVGERSRSVKAEVGVTAAEPATLEASNHAPREEDRKDAVTAEAAPATVKAAPQSAGAMVAAPRLAKKNAAGLSPQEGQTALFQSSLEHLQGGQARLRVIWGPRGHLYVLQRTPSGSTLLVPKDAVAAASGITTTLFELALTETDALDVYVLLEASPDPGSLPVSGSVQGERRRVYPE